MIQIQYPVPSAWLDPCPSSSRKNKPGAGFFVPRSLLEFVEPHIMVTTASRRHTGYKRGQRCQHVSR